MNSVAPASVNLLDLPDDATVEQAIQDFASSARAAYGNRVTGIYLFGSRARGDHKPESDADIAVVLSGSDCGVWTETKRLSGLAYDIFLTSGADIQPWMILLAEWDDPTQHQNPDLIRGIRRDSRLIVSERA